MIDSIDNNVISATLADLIDQVSWLFDGKACAIGVANTGDKVLVNPKFHLNSGSIEGNMPHRIEPGQTGVMLFTRNFGEYNCFKVTVVTNG